MRIMKKWLSRNVTVDGRHIGTAIVTEHDDGKVTAEPFETEQAGVVYTESAINVCTRTHTYNHHHHLTPKTHTNIDIG